MRDGSKWLLVMLGILLAAGYLRWMTQPNLDAQKLEYGFYRYENWGQGKIRWTGKRTMTMITSPADIVGVKVVAAPQNSSPPKGLNFKMFLDEKLLENTWFFGGGQQYLYWHIPGITGNEIKLRMAVNRVFCPADLGMNEDSRVLGVAVSPYIFLRIMPRNGIGFHEWESLDSKRKYRWTRKQASLPAGQYGNTLYLRCAHPDIDQKPVKVIISGDGKVMKELTFSEYDWQKMVLDDRAVKASEVITFEVSRTWNPIKAGISEDARDLGVAVLFSDNL